MKITHYFYHSLVCIYSLAPIFLQSSELIDLTLPGQASNNPLPVFSTPPRTPLNTLPDRVFSVGFSKEFFAMLVEPQPTSIPQPEPSASDTIPDTAIPSNQKTTCKFCHKFFKRKASTTRHIKTCKYNPNRSLTVISCKFCSNIFSKKDTLNQHMVGCRQNPNKDLVAITCRFCNKTFSSKNNTTKHIKICKDNPNRSLTVIPCNFCYRVFSRKNNTTQHMKICRNNPNRDLTDITCRFCCRVFSSKKSTTDHMKICKKKVKN